MRKFWSQKEIEILRDNFLTLNNIELSRLLNRKPKSVIQKIHNLNIRRSKEWKSNRMKMQNPMKNKETSKKVHNILKQKYPNWGSFNIGKMHPELRDRNLKNNPMKNLISREKMRQKILERNHTEKWKKKNSLSMKEWHKNHQHPQFGKHPWQLKPNPMYGKHHTEEIKRKLSEINKGKFAGNKHPNWKGGKSYEPYSSEFTKNLKRQIWNRDNYTCQLCGDHILIQTRNKFITTHHIDYNKKNSNPHNLISLCNLCNISVNRKREEWTKFFQTKTALL